MAKNDYPRMFWVGKDYCVCCSDREWKLVKHVIAKGGTLGDARNELRWERNAVRASGPDIGPDVPGGGAR